MEWRSIYDWICRLKCWKEMIPPNIPFISGCEIPKYKHHFKFAWRKQLNSQSCPSTLYTPKTQPSACVPTKFYTICFHQFVLGWTAHPVWDLIFRAPSPRFHWYAYALARGQVWTCHWWKHGCCACGLCHEFLGWENTQKTVCVLPG